MNVSVSDRFTVDHAVELYGLDGWGDGYLTVREDGHLLVNPRRMRDGGISLFEVIQDLRRRGIKTPVLLRFPQLLESQVERLTGAFARAIREYHYGESYYPVFPIKVNQQRAVIQGLLRSGAEHNLGLEVGSRPELMAAAALSTPPKSLMICNGFKDPDYLSSALLAQRLGKQVFVVVEKPFELESIIRLANGDHEIPFIGFRLRLQAKGSGLWEKSGGIASKFGLTTLQVLRSLERLAAAGLQDKLKLLHFHIGSQVTEVRKIKTAVREATQTYAKLRQMGVEIRYLDVGGGLGIDYDGSRTSSDASVNYTVQEYANDIVFGIKEVCEQQRVPPPAIVSESGRWLVAYHSLLVTDVRGAISGLDPRPLEPTGAEPEVVQELAEAERTMTVKNYREFYHDALEYRDQMYSLYNLGLLGLQDRAKAESLFWSIAAKAVRYSKTAKFVAEEFLELETKLHDKYICNFSVFQSLPDHWALDQLFPVVPIHRLNERPEKRATLVDITCDSDGEVHKFADRRTLKEALELHDVIPGQAYYLAFLLIGAYQETMGDLHNLFGRVHEAEVQLGAAGRPEVLQVRRGEMASQTLQSLGYCEDELTERIESALGARAESGEIDVERARRLAADYRERLRLYTYLD